MNGLATPTTSGGATRPVRVLYIRDHIVWSGGTIYFLDTLPRLDPDRLEVRFFVLRPDKVVAEQFKDAGVDVAPLDAQDAGSLALRRVLKEIRAYKPDFLHLSGPRAMLWGRMAGAITGIPTILRFNNALAEPGPQIWVQRRLAAFTERGMAVSGATADWAAKTYAIPRERIEVIYSGRDLKPFFDVTTGPASPVRARIRAELGLDADAKVLILSGRVVDAQKGQMGMIRAMPRLRARIPGAHLLIVGTGADLAACRALVDSLGLAGAVTLTGLRRDMPDLLAASDLALVPSLVEEAFGFVALEASACGLPVVAFRAGGLPEAVHHDKHGLLVPKGDWDGLVDAAASCLADDALYARLSGAGRLFARDFSPDVHCERLTRFHERLAQRSKDVTRDKAVAHAPQSNHR